MNLYSYILTLMHRANVKLHHIYAESLRFTVLLIKLTPFKMHTSLQRSYQTTSCVSLMELIMHTIIIKMSYPRLLSASSRKPLTRTRVLLGYELLIFL